MSRKSWKLYTGFEKRCWDLRKKECFYVLYQIFSGIYSGPVQLKRKHAGAKKLQKGSVKFINTNCVVLYARLCVRPWR